MPSSMCKAFAIASHFSTLFTLDDLFRWGFLLRSLYFGAFADDWMPCRWFDGRPCHSPWCFSPRLWPTGRRAKEPDTPAHRPAHLPEGD